jgi:hypothetical protein
MDMLIYKHLRLAHPTVWPGRIQTVVAKSFGIPTIAPHRWVRTTACPETMPSPPWEVACASYRDDDTAASSSWREDEPNNKSHGNTDRSPPLLLQLLEVVAVVDDAVLAAAAAAAAAAAVVATSMTDDSFLVEVLCEWRRRCQVVVITGLSGNGGRNHGKSSRSGLAVVIAKCRHDRWCRCRIGDGSVLVRR